MEMNKSISVITPAEKNENYINIALESLRKQTYTNFEVLILHSDIEALKKVIDEVYLNDKRYKFLQTPSDVNVGAVRNIGIEKAAGDYIYFLDSDDYISENMFELLTDNINDYPMIRGRMKSTDFSSSSIIILPGTNRIKMFSNKRYNLIRNNSAVNFLISKKTIENMNLR